MTANTTDRVRDQKIRKYAKKLPTGLRLGDKRNNAAYRYAVFLTHDMALGPADALPWLLDWDGQNAEPLGRAFLEGTLIPNAVRYGNNPIGAGLTDGPPAGANGFHPADPAATRGDAWEPPANGPAPAAAGAPPGYRFDVMDSAAFDAADFRREWLVKRFLVRGEPAVIGGPQKSLKTSVAVDLAVSLASGTPFLGEFEVYKPVRVAMLSAESGEGTLRETARRVCAARGLRLADLGDRLNWGFRLPSLSNPGDLDELTAGLRRNRTDVFMNDPLYLSLLDAAAGDAVRLAGNMYAMGPLLRAVDRACKDAGATPLLVHHFKQTRANPHAEPQLEDLAFAGIGQFARQWVLLGRREPFDPAGRNKLWLTAGGSAGQCGLWTLDVDEGAIDDDFQGRTWAVEVETAGAARRVGRTKQQHDKAERERQQDTDDDTKFVNAIDHLSRKGRPTTLRDVRTMARLGHDRAARARERLMEAGAAEEFDAVKMTGRGHSVETKVKCLRRTGGTGGPNAG